MIKPFHVLLVLCFVVLSSCKLCKRKSVENAPAIQLSGTAQRYHAAMGAGDGVLFLVRLESKSPLDKAEIHADSLVIHGKRIPATLRADSAIIIEGNYFVPKAERTPESPVLPTLTAPDPILYLEQYYPATLYFHYLEKAYALPITEFESISD